MSTDTEIKLRKTSVADEIIVASTGVSSVCVSDSEVIIAEEKKSERDIAAAKKASFLGDGPLGKTMWFLTWPDFIGKMVQAMYVLIDAIYIGQMAGNTQADRSLSLAACTLAMPMDQLFHIAIGLLIGVGASTVYGQNLGKGNSKEARSVVGNMYVMCAIVGICYPAIVYWFIDDLLILTGASAETGTLQLARDYFTPLAFGDIFACLAVSHNNVIRGEGNPIFSALGMLSGAVVNIILDPILIKATGNSIKGAAYATICGNATCSILGMIFYSSKRSAIRLQLEDFKPRWSVMKSIMNVGVSAAISTGSGSIVTLLMNNLLIKYSTKNYNSMMMTEILAVVGACSKLSFFCFMPMLSLAHGCLPILSFCYGAKKFNRFQNAMKIQFFCEVILGAILILFGGFCGGILAGMFSSSPFFHEIFSEGLRYCTSGLIFNAVTMAMFPALQACGRGIPSAVILFLKQLVFLLGFAQFFCWLVDDWWGNMYAYPVAEVVGALISAAAFFFYRSVFKGLKE